MEMLSRRGGFASFPIASIPSILVRDSARWFDRAGRLGLYAARMKRLLLPLVALLAIAPLSADDTPLAEEMDRMNDIYKALRRGTVEDGPAAARKAQEHVLKMLALTPAFVEEGGHAGPKDLAMAEYRKQIGQLYVIWCEMELAQIAGDEQQVDAVIQKLKDSKKVGHDEFMEE